MIRFRALGVRFSLPLLSLLFPLLAARLGMKGDAAALALSLGVHEMGHLLAAKLARVEVREIRLLPIGGSIRMENPYGLSPAQLIATALAGPAANFALMLLCGALAQWGLIAAEQAAGVLKSSLVLLLFNLLPALPLDGGRALYALLQPHLGARRALALGVWLGRLLAAALLVSALCLRLRSGRWNLSFLLAAVFLIGAERDERDALLRSRAELMAQAISPDTSPLPARLYQIDGRMKVSDALHLLRPRESAWFVLMEDGAPRGMIDGRSLVRQAMKDAQRSVGSLECFRLTREEGAANFQ